MSETIPDISVVVPVHDEEGAAGPLAREIAAAFAGRSYEMVFVDDASRDGTLAELRGLMSELPTLRVLSHGANAGQSRAVRTGVRPDGRVLAPVMPWNNYATLTDADARALARYLRSLPPVRNATPRMVGASETPTAPYLTVVVPGR